MPTATARARHNLILAQPVSSLREPTKEGIVVGLSHVRFRTKRERVQADHRGVAAAQAPVARRRRAAQLSAGS